MFRVDKTFGIKINLLTLLCLLTSINGIAQVWQNLNMSNSGLASNRIATIAFDNESNLWAAYVGVGGEGLGIAKYDGTTWTDFNTTNSGLPNNDIRSIACDKTGNMWFGCYYGGVTKFDGVNWTVYNTGNSNIIGDNVNTINIDNNNNIWIGGYETGVSKFDGINWINYNFPTAPFPEFNCINQVFVDKDDHVWIALDCAGGLVELNTTTNQWNSYTTSNSLIPHHTVNAVIEDNSGLIWVGLSNNKVSSFDGINWTTYDLTSSVQWSGFSLDQQGNVWCGTGDGLYKFDGTSWRKILNGLGSSHHGVSLDNNGNVWWGEQNNGIWKGNNQLTDIPDVNFKQCLKETHPEIFNEDDFVIVEEAKKIESIQCEGRSIESISGIEKFENVSYLDFSSNNIGNVDGLSALTKLVTLDFYQNNIVALPSLEASTDLGFLLFSQNRILTFPDLSKNLKISWLSFNSNQFTVVPDLSIYQNLTMLEVGSGLVEQLPSLDQNLALRRLDISSTYLASFPDLTKNVNLEELDFSNNPQFSNWPDIISNTNLTYLSCSYNNLMTLPDLSIYTKLEAFICAGNQLTSLPDLSALSELRILDCSYNALSQLPDLSQTNIGVIPISQLDVSYNQLTFEDLLPLVKSKTYEWIKTSGQKLPTTDSFITKKTGEMLMLNINIDNAITNNVYQWYKDNTIIDTSEINTLTISNITASDAGIYTCIISNPDVPDLEILWSKLTLTVSTGCEIINLNSSDYNLQITPATCITGGKILIEENGSRPLANTSFELKQNGSGNALSFPKPEMVNLVEGEYTLTLIQDGCPILWPEEILIDKNSNCNNPVISPNKDGILEDYYIPFPGVAKIYDRSGALVKQLPIPGTWDGTDNSGAPLPMGTYIIQTDMHKEIIITIIK